MAERRLNLRQAGAAVNRMRAVGMSEPVRRYISIYGSLLCRTFTMAWTARSVSRPPPLRLANTGSLAPASPRSVPLLPLIESCTRSSRGRTSAQVKLTISKFGEYPSDEMILQAVVRIARAALKGQP